MHEAYSVAQYLVGRKPYNYVLTSPAREYLTCTVYDEATASAMYNGKTRYHSTHSYGVMSSLGPERSMRA
jgi:hypothetical protein